MLGYQYQLFQIKPLTLNSKLWEAPWWGTQQLLVSAHWWGHHVIGACICCHHPCLWKRICFILKKFLYVIEVILRFRGSGFYKTYQSLGGPASDRYTHHAYNMRLSSTYTHSSYSPHSYPAFFFYHTVLLIYWKKRNFCFLLMAIFPCHQIWLRLLLDTIKCQLQRETGPKIWGSIQWEITGGKSESPDTQIPFSVSFFPSCWRACDRYMQNLACCTARNKGNPLGWIPDLLCLLEKP